MLKKLLLTMLAIAICSGESQAQRSTDKLDRGLIAVPASSGNFVSWRILAEEYYDVTYNLYCNGSLLKSGLKVSNYSHTGGNSSSKYQVAAVVRGVEQERCAEVTRWAAQYKDVPLKDVTNRNGAVVTSKYEINDVSLGDVTGDGITEFILKRNNTGGDLTSSSNKTDFNLYEVYNLKGDRLWWIDLGPNLMAGPDEQWDMVAFDWDQDGKAECLMRGADNMIIHTATGRTINIGNMNYYAPRDEYTHQGAEYLLYLNGETGEPYGWNGQDTWTPMAYPLPRFEAGESDYASVWGKADTGHRSSKHYFGAPFLDGRKPSIFLGRGAYTRHKMCALDVDPVTHQLTQRWRWNEYSGSSKYFGNGFHNYQIADVDWDGRDEIVFGSMVIDDNGKGLCTTGLGHGDAQHCSDLDPYRHGQEQFTCNETSPACAYWNATTAQMYYRLQSTGDDGRALAGNFSNQFPGSMGRTTQTGLVSCVADKVITGGPATEGTNDALYWSHLNQRIYWDGDLLDEVFDSPGSAARAGAIYKPGGGRLANLDGSNTANASKNNPGAIGDIFGDWREEVVMRCGTQGSKTLRIFTTSTPTTYGLYTLWHDHQYRNAMVWQCVGYNQPPHKSYFVGELEGITVAPPPLTMTGRTEVANGGTIGTALNDKHAIVCETADTKISVAQGAKPYIVTFNVPSWVQGTNSQLTNGKAVINYTYYTCDVTGAAFEGGMRLVKQGDGILNLPAVEQKYTGPTDIWAGTVNFDGKLLESPVWMNRFAELNSDGGQFQSVKMDYDAKLRPGRADHKGTLTVGSLTLGFGSRVVFDIYGDLTSDQLHVSQLTIETKNWNYGPNYLTPVFEFVNHATGGLVPGKYLIGKVEKITGKLSDIKLEGLGNEMRRELMLEDGNLYLVIETVRSASEVVWSGSEDGVWDLSTTRNFTFAGSERPEYFVAGDVVTFNDAASNFTVNITDEVEPDSIIVDNSKNKAYTFKGNGSIVGKSKLVKRGAGTLTIQTDNSFVGGTHLSGGVLKVSSLCNENQAQGHLGGLNVTLNKITIDNGAELNTTAAVTNGSNIIFASTEGGVINNAADFIVNKAMSGTVATKKGSGWMKLNISNTGLQKLVIMAGTVQCVNATTPAKSVEFQGGTLSENGSTSYPIHVVSGKSATWNLVNDATYSNQITGEGTITISCPVREGGSGDSKWYATRTQVALNLADFNGTLKPVSNGDPSGRFTLSTAKGMPNGTMNIASGVEVQNSGKTFRIGKLMGSGALGGTCTFSSAANNTANTWQVGNDQNWSTTVQVVSNANLVKVGTGKVSWNAKNSNSGTTQVNEGELAIGTQSKLGTGVLTIGANGTLSGSNTATSALENASVLVNGVIRPGLLETSYSGGITLAGKPMTINQSGVLVINAARNATGASTGCTTLAGISKLTINGTIRVVALASHTLQVGDMIRVFTADSFAGTPKFEFEGGVEWDTSRISEGLLIVKSVVVDGIDAVSLSVHSPADIYDLNGRLVRARATDVQGLPAGVYLCRGKKIVVR